MNLENLTTERRNEETFGLDEMSVSTALEKMNKEDKKVAEAVEKALPMIEPVIEKRLKVSIMGATYLSWCRDKWTSRCA